MLSPFPCAGEQAEGLRAVTGPQSMVAANGLALGGASQPRTYHGLDAGERAARRMTTDLHYLAEYRMEFSDQRAIE